MSYKVKFSVRVLAIILALGTIAGIVIPIIN